MVSTVNSIRLNIRTKLLLVSLTLFSIPWIGYEYLIEMENFLRRGQEDVLLARAQAASAILEEQINELTQSEERTSSNVLYAYPLTGPIQLDGYDHEWEPYLEYANQNPKSKQEATSLSFQSLLGVYQNYLYILLQVEDEDWIKMKAGTLQWHASDYIDLNLSKTHKNQYLYRLLSSSPGWMSCYQISKEKQDIYVIQAETRIKAEWQRNEQGYTVEISVPLSMLRGHIAMAVGDVDKIYEPIVKEIVTVNFDNDLPGKLTLPSEQVRSILNGLGYQQVRTWVLNTSGQMLAVTGNLKAKVEKQQNHSLIHFLYTLLLPQPTFLFEDEHSGAYRLQGLEIDSALMGKEATKWRQTPDNKMVILSAAYPIKSEGKVSGVVYLEETNYKILTFHNKAIENLLNRLLLVIFFMVSILLIFASHLSSRIRQLRDQTESIISDDGKISRRFPEKWANDEIGDLGRSFALMLQRLKQYTDYLENISSKISHELRTPLAILRSSLDNLSMCQLSEAAEVYSERAKKGVLRLSKTLTQMSEATRLEQILQDSVKQPFDLTALLHGCFTGYQDIYKNQSFKLNIPHDKVILYGDSDLIECLLDKLVANAVDFSKKGEPVIIQLQTDATSIYLSIINRGEKLLDNMKKDIFNSMISLRKNNLNGSHLGLGLYIVRMIADYHQAKVTANNHAHGVWLAVTFKRGVMSKRIINL